MKHTITGRELIYCANNNRGILRFLFLLLIILATQMDRGSCLIRRHGRVFRDDPVGDFYVHLVDGTSNLTVDDKLTSSNRLLKLGSNGKPTVIHFYDGGWGGCRPCAAQMKKWALSPWGDEVNFLCVCVESAQVARSFHNMFDFGRSNRIDGKGGKVINGYIPSRSYMPVGYGQLGCSGFIISDSQGNFVSRKTAAYLQFGEDAFRNVESVLSELILENDELNEENEEEETKFEAPNTLAIDRFMTNNHKEEKKSNTNTSENHNNNNDRVVVTSNNQIMKVPNSVGVESMDDEHKECTDSFNRAMKDPSHETLQALYEILKSHFKHEEDLLEQYNSSKGKFSAAYSHRMDHERILDIATAELGRVASIGITKTTTCGMEQGGRGASWRKPATKPTPLVSSPSLTSSEIAIDSNVLHQLAKAFHIHAETFDALYHAQIPATAE